MAPKAGDPSRNGGAQPESPRLARGPVGVSSLVSRLTRAAVGSRGLAGADLIGHWRTIVGPELALLATPASLKRPRDNAKDNGGTLLLRVASGAAATILQLKGPQIVERVNRYFGYRAVANLQIVPGSSGKVPTAVTADAPVPPAVEDEVARTVAGVDKPDLRAALARLGIAVRRRTAARR